MTHSPSCTACDTCAPGPMKAAVVLMAVAVAALVCVLISWWIS